MTKAALLAAAFAGTQAFPPVEVFAPDTSNTVMTGALLHDLFDTRSAAHPGTPLVNPVRACACVCACVRVYGRLALRCVRCASVRAAGWLVGCVLRSCWCACVIMQY